MQNYKKILTANDFELLLEFFEKMSVEEFSLKVNEITKYLQLGYKRAKESKFADCQKLDIEEYITFLKDLHWMAVSMGDYKKNCMVLIGPDRDIKINVYALLDFVASCGSLEEITSTLGNIKSVVINYSDSENASQYKSIYRLVEDIEYLFDLMIDNHPTPTSSPQTG